MTIRKGDDITVEVPRGPGAVGASQAELIPGLVKFVGDNGKLTWYCVGTRTCGFCGPGSDQGHHRLGMGGSRIVD